MATLERHCRICMVEEGRGLADLLIEPCGCSGTVAHAHLRRAAVGGCCGLAAGAAWLAHACRQVCTQAPTLPCTRSCLFAWRLHKAAQLRDPDSCEVCGQRYQVPADAWRAFVAQQGRAATRRLRLAQLWQRARPPLARVARAAGWLLSKYFKAAQAVVWTVQVRRAAGKGGAGSSTCRCQAPAQLPQLPCVRNVHGGGRLHTW